MPGGPQFGILPGSYGLGADNYLNSYGAIIPAAPAPAAPAPVAPAPTAPTPSVTGGINSGVHVVAGNPQSADDINVADFAGQLVTDPSLMFSKDDPNTSTNESMMLSDRVPNMTANSNELIDGTQYTGDADALNQQASQGTATTIDQVDPRQANTYDAAQTQANVEQNGQATAAQGQLSAGSIIDENTIPQINTDTIDGTNTGQALKEFAYQDITNIVDTTTSAGKALAEQLGQFNYTDSKATLKGQLDILQAEFTGANGEPVIPSWAAATARNVQKIAAFKGMTGTAATAALAQAMLEASIPIAQADSAFFQTVTLQNLNNKQAQTINRANVLAKMDLTNLDNRMAAAVQNSKNFMDMDLKNLDNEQQAEMVNTQNRVQSILEDAKAKNAERLFTADSQNDMDKFYDELGTAIAKYNADQLNSMEMYNTGEDNSMKKFNSDMTNNREQFYKNMQFNVDIANAKWRQSITMANSEMQFEAAATDVKNMVGVSVEQLNQLWDRSDALLDYVWKSSESELDRKAALTMQNMKADAESSAGWGSVFGTIAGEVAKDIDFGSIFDWIF